MNNDFVSILNFLSAFLSCLGAINWGLVIFFQFDFVKFFSRPFVRIKLDKVFYGFIALSGFYTLLMLFKFI